MYMVKVVSFSEAAYALLKRHKKEGMSFSDVVQCGRWDAEPEKTKDMKDLIAWAESFPKKKKKVNWSEHVKDILYGEHQP